MKRFAFALLALTALPVLAATETYVVEPGHSFARFGYTHLGYSTQISRFNKTSGSFSFDAAAGTGSVDITIDTTSVDTGSDIFNKHIYYELHRFGFDKFSFFSECIVHCDQHKNIFITIQLILKLKHSSHFRYF